MKAATIYRRDDLHRLQRTLRKQPKLQVIRTHNLDQVLIDSELRTRNGFTYTLDGLMRVCERLNLRLASLLKQLLGVRARRNVADEVEVNKTLTAKLFNEFARSKFHRLKGRVMICDGERRTIETESKSAPKAFAGSEFLDCCLDAAEDDHQFQFATMHGRKLFLGFRSNEKISVENPEGKTVNFYPGKILVASDIGHYYLRLANAILRHSGYAAEALWTPYTKADFQLRNRDPASLARPAIKTFFETESFDATWVEDQLDALINDPLLPAVRDAFSHRRYHHILFKQLRAGLNTPDVNRILTRAELPMELRSDPLCVRGIVARSGAACQYAASRRWYHVFESLLYWQFRIDDGRHCRHSECVSSVAFRILRGDRKLSPPSSERKN